MKMYSKKVIEHIEHARNIGVMEDANGIGEVASPVCGEFIHVYIKVVDDCIADIMIDPVGCGATLAAASVATTLVKGKTLPEAFRINGKQITEVLGGLPEKKFHCAVLVQDGIRAAIEDYKKRLRE